MKDFAPHIYTFILPLFVGNVVHMFIVKGNYFQIAAKPISIDLFGAGKTYRAFMALPLICGICAMVFRSLFLHYPHYSLSFRIGFMLGLAYLVGELPNSFIKRRLGIASGQQSSRYRLVQNIVDKSDSLLTACVVYLFIYPITAGMIATLFAVSFFIHVFFSWLLVQFRIKKSF